MCSRTNYPPILERAAVKAPVFRYIGRLSVLVAALKRLQRL